MPAPLLRLLPADAAHDVNRRSSGGFGLPRSFIARALLRAMAAGQVAGSAWFCNAQGHWIALEDDGAGADAASSFALRLTPMVGMARRTIVFDVAILLQHYVVTLPSGSFRIAFLPALDQAALAAAARTIMQEAVRAAQPARS
ncbi:MAG: hypothetical protein GAK35_01092 [Herbaspirillum frisingense]|uniref:Uncharacterized protein n=1 Tax=Herbaspirillum frisingense TaxID=92645 RepID=A0A7V8FYP3_9BURK|nr:MAG: hypothetical protein GAK35_01092 [Herbaspirillum frisingense]